ncbi:ABC transporter permease [Clostridium estertheticum]|uniref:ABC transporter permease n=1 Tax=Clostridium estertheticum TaxID=238834 RepID=UPI001CF1E5D5|nr:ABC transporter permease [Clostridium estertheticum]MCB2356457.1 ABC transporter permease [Clostridium estertheticum]WAG43590.1 ABC transporter permease [Clostridium estertheticum]
MSFLNYLNLEFIKIKSSFIKYVIIAPLILSALMNILDMTFRKESMLKTYNKVVTDGFYSLIIENHLALAWPLFLLLSILITSISLFYIDMKNNLLTHIFASPVNRSKYYLAKLVTILISTTLIIIMEGILLIVIGKVFSLSNTIDIELVIRYMWFEFFSCLGIISFQVLLFSMVQDIMFLTTINIVALFGSIPFLRNPSIIKFNPYLQLVNCTPFSDSDLLIGAIICSIIYMCVFNILGIICFNHKDIQGE